MALSQADMTALVGALFQFLQNHPAVTPTDMRAALSILERRQAAVDGRTQANNDAALYGLPAL